MAGSVTAALSAIGGEAAPAATPAKTNPAAAAHAPAKHVGEGALVVVPAGFIADIVGGLSGTVGELTGGFFGKPKLGKQIGEAASPLIKLLPFQVIPAEVAPQSAGPDGQGAAGPAEDLIVVPAGFLGGILGGIGGKLLGGQVDRWFGGNGGTGSTIGSTVGGAIGAVLPFQVVPPAAAPADGEAPGEPMVVVPAGFFGDLLGGVAGAFGGLVGGKQGRAIGDAAAPIISQLVPFQEVPPALTPASAGPDGAVADEERLVVVPAGFFGSIVGGLASTIGGEIGGLFGGSDTGAAIGGVAGKLLESVLPFHEVPPALAPASADPAGQPSDDKLILVPAGLFGNLLSGLAGAAGGVAGGLLGDAKTGRAVGDAAAPFLKLLPFQVVAPGGVE